MLEAPGVASVGGDGEPYGAATIRPGGAGLWQARCFGGKQGLTHPGSHQEEAATSAGDWDPLGHARSCGLAQECSIQFSHQIHSGVKWDMALLSGHSRAHRALGGCRASLGVPLFLSELPPVGSCFTAVSEIYIFLLFSFHA